ncbi:MAG: M28 family peptidase [Fimbriimonas sp.]
MPAPAPVSVVFDQGRAWNDLLKQLSFGPRMAGSAGQIKGRDHIVEELKLSCQNVRTQELTHLWSRGAKRMTMWNVVGDQNWANAKTRILLITHWDTRPTADQEWDAAAAKKPIMGANDGASGVAVLLELARVLKQTLPPDVGVTYLFTDGEDLGPSLSEMFLGAVHFTKNMPKPRPDYGILIDMIGDKNLEVPMEPNSAKYAPELLKALYEHAEKIGLGKTFPKITGPEIEDDHISLNKAGLPTIDLIDFDYEHWHTLGDTVDKVSADSLGKVGKLLQTWLEQKPAFQIKK